MESGRPLGPLFFGVHQARRRERLHGEDEPEDGRGETEDNQDYLDNALGVAYVE
jgi:hypothetical protein